MGAKSSSEAGVATFPAEVVDDQRERSQSHGFLRVDPVHQGVGFRPRTRSLGGGVGHRGHPVVITTDGEVGAADTTDGQTGGRTTRRRFVLGSSLHLLTLNGIKCPICSKFVPPDNVELHLVLCMTKPKITYNEDILTESRGECVICFDELNQGDAIARLPCLCIYHKRCIDDWFKVNRSCPEHPGD